MTESGRPARARDALARVDPFNEGGVEGALREGGAAGCEPGAVFQPVRVAISGKTVSAGVFESVALLGKEESFARIDSSLIRPAFGRPSCDDSVERSTCMNAVCALHEM